MVGGRLFPLPAGEWHDLINEHHGGDPLIESSILVRLAGDRVQAIMVVRLTLLPTPAAAKLPYGALCGSLATLEARIVPGTGSARECWAITGAELMPGYWGGPRVDEIYTRAIDRLAVAGMTVPAMMIAAEWYHADPDNWAMVEYMFDPGADPAAPTDPVQWRRNKALAHPESARYIQRVADWAGRFTPLLQKAIGGNLDGPMVEAAFSPNDPP